MRRSAVLIRVCTASVLPILAGVCAPLSLAAPASAQQPIKPVETNYVVVTGNDSTMRCYMGSAYYSVAPLKAGQVLAVDGQQGAWLRVAYPAGLKAFVKAEEATVDEAAKTVKLSAASRLRAANMAGGERGHWWQLLDEDLAAGTVLPLTDVLKSPDNRVYGYFVSAPAKSRGYVRSDQVRAATAAEAASASAPAKPADAPASNTPKPAPTPAPAGTTPAGTTPPGTTPPAATPPATTPPATTPPAATPPAPNTPGSGTTPTAPANTNPPAVTPVPAGTTPPAATPPTEGDKPAERIVVKPVTPKVDEAAVKRRAKVESLGAVFERVRAQDLETAELDTAIAEFERAQTSLGSDGEDGRLRAFLKPRLEILTMRADLQKSRRAAQAAAQTLTKDEANLGQQVAAIERTKVYTLIGRLVPSIVYDGKELPKMYRLISVDPVFSRTVGYVQPVEGIELEQKVGRVVGVLGDSRVDDSLRLNIVTPRQIDILFAREAAMTPAAPEKGETPAKPE